MTFITPISPDLHLNDSRDSLNPTQSAQAPERNVSANSTTFRPEQNARHPARFVTSPPTTSQKKPFVGREQPFISQFPPIVVATPTFAPLIRCKHATTTQPGQAIEARLVTGDLEPTPPMASPLICEVL
ncbi:MAG: hypothetical protein Q4D91_09120 [Lautropia sp.]|nr:hypothetical protein [Lautropia sp.]